jgi:hypothetical protein
MAAGPIAVGNRDLPPPVPPFAAFRRLSKKGFHRLAPLGTAYRRLAKGAASSVQFALVRFSSPGREAGKESSGAGLGVPLSPRDYGAGREPERGVAYLCHLSPTLSPRGGEGVRSLPPLSRLVAQKVRPVRCSSLWFASVRLAGGRNKHQAPQVPKLQRNSKFQTSIGYGQAPACANIEHPTFNNQHRKSNEWQL